MFTDNNINKSFDLLYKAKDSEKNEIYKNRIDKLLLGIRYLYIVRLEMDYPNRNELIDEFYADLKKHKITEIFERTSLEFSINTMKKSKYAKDREGWYSLYYIMK